MEKNWADLIGEEKKLKSPAWHETVLKDREEAYKAGKSHRIRLGTSHEKDQKEILKKIRMS